MPDTYVFPGGAVDPADHDMRLQTPVNDICAGRLRQKQTGVSPDSLACAGIRELWEETGLVLGTRSGETLIGNGSALTFFFRAITPADRPIRYDARFFLADAKHLNGRLTHMGDDPELDDLSWIDLDQARRLKLPLITDMVLAELSSLSGTRCRPHSVPFFHMGSAEHGQNGFSRLA